MVSGNFRGLSIVSGVTNRGSLERMPRQFTHLMRIPTFTALVLLTIFSAKAQQGSVSFINSAATPIRSFGQGFTGTVALYGSTATNLTSDASLEQIGATANTFAPGIFSGGTRNIGSPGDWVTLQVRAWTAGFATYEMARAASLGNPYVLFGYSSFWQQPVGGGTLPTAPITGAGRFNGMIVPNIPEPNCIALALFGALVIGVYARRHCR